jgi:hypothetical protein
MDRKRKNIPAGVRWNVFQRDEFRCVYCGWARKDGADLVVDHGDPFSKGGADDLSNYVTACKPCNDGKKAKIVIPPAAELDAATSGVTRRGVFYKNNLHADWGDALRLACTGVEYWATADDPHAIRTVMCRNGYDGINMPQFDCFHIDFKCDFISEVIGKINVVVVGNCDRGFFSEQDKGLIRNAAILGYEEPTAIIIGSPWYYWAAVVNDRYKGCPAGFALDDYLNPGARFWSAGWYPDENWDFSDPRDDFELKPACFTGRGWWLSIGDVAAEMDDMGEIYGRGSKHGL